MYWYVWAYALVYIWAYNGHMLSDNANWIVAWASVPLPIAYVACKVWIWWMVPLKKKKTRNHDIIVMSSTLLDCCLKNYTTLWNIWTYQLMCKKNYTTLWNIWTYQLMCNFSYTTAGRFICFTGLCKLFKQRTWLERCTKVHCMISMFYSTDHQKQSYIQ